jgi:hypothetical protein
VEPLVYLQEEAPQLQLHPPEIPPEERVLGVVEEAAQFQLMETPLQVPVVMELL